MKRLRLRDIGEFGLIERIKAGAVVSKSVLKGIGDDCAVIKFNKDKYLLLTCDMMVEGVHFDLKIATPYQIGHKALASALSDIAAMGGVPKEALVSIGLDPALSLSFLDRLYRGMKILARRFGVDLVGGDLVRSKSLIICVNLTGFVKKKNLTLRSGAKDNDAIMITGALGGSILKKNLTFIPRLKEAQALVKRFKINSMIDVSDGLVQDLDHIASESNLGAIIFERDIPISSSAYRQARMEARSPLQIALQEGEDFELLFTMPKDHARRLLGLGPKGIGARVTMIGQMTDEPGLWLVDKIGKKLKLAPRGYQHF